MRRMLAPLVTIKHILNKENATINSGARLNIELVQGVVQTGVSSVTDVVEGSLVKTVYIEIWLKSNASAGTNTKFQVVLEKVMGATAAITFTQMNNLMTYPNKKNVFYITQGVMGDLTTGSLPIMRGWFAIPRGKQRFGLDDQLVLSISSTGAVIQACGLSIFKEWK